MKCVLLSSNTSWYLWKFRKSTIEALLAKNFHVICVAPLDNYSALLEDLGVEFIAVPMEGQSTNIVKELGSLLAIFRIIVSKKPDFVFNFTIKMNLYLGLPCRLLGIPYANNVSGLGTAFLYEGWAFTLARFVYGISNKGAQKVFFQNAEDQQTFLSKGLVHKNKTVLLPGSGVDLQRFAPAPLPENSVFTFVMIARLIADKGVREYVAAAKQVKQLYPDTRFLLVGPGAVSNKSAIPEHELNQWMQEGLIEYVGEQENVIPWIAQAHVLVLPSYREGMPRTVLEAASIGRPAIVTDVPGCRQAIEAGKTGWLCKVKDVDDLADKMRKVLQLDEQALMEFSRNSRRFAEENFSEQIVIERYLECLFSVIPA